MHKLRCGREENRQSSGRHGVYTTIRRPWCTQHAKDLGVVRNKMKAAESSVDMTCTSQQGGNTSGDLYRQLSLRAYYYPPAAHIALGFVDILSPRGEIGGRRIFCTDSPQTATVDTCATYSNV